MAENKITDSFGALISLLDQAKAYRTRMAEDRTEAQLLYDGNVGKWLPQDVKGRSVVVSDDVSATIGKLLPAVVRTILGNEIVAEYGAQEEADQPGSEQATEFINLVLLDRSKARDAIHDAIHDAAVKRNGILHVYPQQRVEVRGSAHTDLDDNSLTAIINEEGVEVLDHKSKPAPPDEMGRPALDEMTGEPAVLHDIKIKRTVKKITPRMSAVPMEEYLIHPDAVNSNEDSPIVGREYVETRSNLKAMMMAKGEGKDVLERIEALSAATFDPTQESEKQTRRKGYSGLETPEARELHPVQVFNLYVRLDVDGDGIAELRHVMLFGGEGAENVFVDEYADFVPFYDVVIERLPHQWEGVSITDHVAEIMLAKTALLRGAQDNLYMVNDPQVAVNERVQNPDSVINRQPGRPIFLKGGDKAGDAISWNDTPFVADKALMGIAYWDKQIVDRCGIDDSSAGLPPDALQNVTAKASAMLEQKGIAKTEMIVKTIAECLKGPFTGLLKLTIQHNDKPEKVRLRNKYVSVDPRQWNADMDVNINIGLGAGTRERDMMVMQGILALQDRVIQTFGAQNPWVTPKNVANTLRKSVQAAGIPVADPFFNNPEQQEIDQYFQQKAQEKPLEIQQIEAQSAAKAQELQMTLPFEMQAKQMDVEAAKQKEIVQSQAAVEERAAIAQIEAQGKADELALKKYEIDTKAQVEREKMQFTAVSSEKDRDASVQQAAAKSFSDGIAKNEAGEAKDKPKQDDTLKELIATLNKPKRFVRDPKTGDISGIEPESPTMN
jgi:hypothetical protein